MKAFDIGLSALRAQQQTLSTLGNNLANAATPGYHRQRVELADRVPMRSGNLFIGSGVDATGITRLRNSAIESALLRTSSEAASSQETLEIAKQLESVMTPGEASIHASLSSFFNRLEKVSNAPQDMTVRQEFLTSASELMESFNSVSTQMATLSRDVRLNVSDGVQRVNQLVADIAGLNFKIFQSRATGAEPNDLLDRRDQLVSQLSEWTEAEAVTLPGGREQVLIAGGAVAIGTQPVTFKVRDFKNGTTGITVNDLPTPLTLNSGRLQAMTSALNETLPAFRNRLQELATQVVRMVDQQHAEGITDQGAFSLLSGSRSVADVDVPLARSGSAFPIQSGDLYVTITEKATGIRRTEKLTIDAQSDSLTDVANQLSALSGVVASVDTARRTLSISAEGPYQIDFAGRPDNVPYLSSMTGTSRPVFSGLYSGSAADAWNVTFSGAGTIGVTPGLTATVRDGSGQVIAVKDVGAGYEAGTSFEIRDGVSLSLGSGTVDAADTFTLPLTNVPDSTGILAALGINSLFEGSQLGDLHVRESLRTNPARLASSITGLPGDALNLAAMSGLRDIRVDELGGRTFVEEMADLTAESGLASQTAENRSTQLQAYQSRLSADRDAISGVDVNQEMLEMMETQRAYQAAARYLTTADEMIEELLQLTR